MKELPLLKDIVAEYPKENIITWSFIQVNEVIRVYYKLVNETERDGVFFYAVNWAGGSGDFENLLDDQEASVECLFMGTAYFDGLRHLYMGDEQTDNYGYLNYPNMKYLIQTLTAIDILVKKHCEDADDR